MSWPAEKALPAPVITRTSVFGSIARASSASSISMCNCGLIALRWSGRLKITYVIPPSRSILIVSYFLSAIIFSLAVGFKDVASDDHFHDLARALGDSITALLAPELLN